PLRHRLEIVLELRSAAAVIDRRRVAELVGLAVVAVEQPEDVDERLAPIEALVDGAVVVGGALARALVGGRGGGGQRRRLPGRRAAILLAGGVRLYLRRGFRRPGGRRRGRGGR